MEGDSGFSFRVRRGRGGRFCRERAEREGRDLRLCAESKVLEAGDLDKNDTWEIEQKRHSTALGL